MKTQILSRGNALISLIGFLLIVATTLFGCGVLFKVNRVISLDPVLLAHDDLPMMMRLTSSDRFRGNTELSFIVEFEQRWNGSQLVVRYWLFDASSTAKKGVDALSGTIATELFFHPELDPDAAELFFHPELNPEGVIGDATWCHVNWKTVKKSSPILFVKNNVGVLVMTSRPSSNQLQFAWDIARRIEAKIVAVLDKR